MEQYIAELDRITMRVFMRLMSGEELKFDIPTEDARAKLQRDYIEIVGGKKVAFEVQSQNQLLSLKITLECLDAAARLNSIGREAYAAELLETLGYKSAKTHEAIAAKIENAANMIRLKLARMELKQPKGRNEDEAKDHYIKERVAMMEYYKMHIDVDRISAAEYAYLLKRMCDDLEKDALRHAQKKK